MTHLSSGTNMGSGSAVRAEVPRWGLWPERDPLFSYFFSRHVLCFPLRVHGARQGPGEDIYLLLDLTVDAFPQVEGPSPKKTLCQV